jgi:hypothetical protein
LDELMTAALLLTKGRQVRPALPSCGVRLRPPHRQKGTRGCGLLAAVPAPDAEHVDKLEDLTPVIEPTTTPWALGGTWTRISSTATAPPALLRLAATERLSNSWVLFPDGEDHAADAGRWRQASILNDLAMLTLFQSCRAVSLLSDRVSCREVGFCVNLAIGLGNLAIDQMRLAIGLLRPPAAPNRLCVRRTTTSTRPSRTWRWAFVSLRRSLPNHDSALRRQDASLNSAPTVRD